MKISEIPAPFRKDIQSAYTILREEGCNSVFIFGSVLNGKQNNNSDIDLGVKGLDPEKFFSVYAKLDFAVKKNIDLIDFDERKDMFDLLNEIGEVEELG